MPVVVVGGSVMLAGGSAAVVAVGSVMFAVAAEAGDMPGIEAADAGLPAPAVPPAPDGSDGSVPVLCK